MGALILVLVAVFAISGSELSHMSDTSSSELMVFVATDEGDIGQIFGTRNKPSKPIVIVEDFIIQAQVNCYKQTTGLVRNLMVPYSQRSYIRSDGTSCTPVE